MSKASEWAALDRQMRLNISEGNEARANHLACVLTAFTSDGNIGQQIAYNHDEALKLARWILDTFEDAPRA